MQVEQPTYYNEANEQELKNKCKVSIFIPNSNQDMMSLGKIDRST